MNLRDMLNKKIQKELESESESQVTEESATQGEIELGENREENSVGAESEDGDIETVEISEPPLKKTRSARMSFLTKSGAEYEEKKKDFLEGKIEVEQLPKIFKKSSQPNFENELASRLTSEELEHLDDKKTDRMIKISIVAVVSAVAVVVLLVLLLLSGFSFDKSIKTPDFKERPLDIVEEWAKKNNVELDIVYQETTDYVNNVVIYQEISEGENIAKGSSFKVYISKKREVSTTPTSTPSATPSATSNPGSENKATPKVQVSNTEIKKLVGKTKAEADKWAKEKTITLTYIDAYNDSVDKDLIGDVSGITIKNKKSSATVTISKGMIVVPTFVGKTREKFEVWIAAANKEGAKLTLKVTEAESEQESGTIIKQADAETKLKVGSTLTIEVSKKIQVQMEDFTGKNKSEIESWATKNKIAITTIYKYSDSVGKDRVINQSVTTGIVADAQKMDITVSLGSFSIPEYRGKTESTVRDDLRKFGDNGVDIALIVREVEAQGIVAGLITEQSYDAGTLTINVAKAQNTFEVQYMVGFSVEEAQKTSTCSENFSCNFLSSNPEMMNEATSTRITRHTTGNYQKGTILDVTFEYYN